MSLLYRFINNQLITLDEDRTTYFYLLILALDEHKSNSQWYQRESNDIFFDYFPENEEEFVQNDANNGKFIENLIFILP